MLPCRHRPCRDAGVTKPADSRGNCHLIYDVPASPARMDRVPVIARCARSAAEALRDASHDRLAPYDLERNEPFQPRTGMVRMAFGALGVLGEEGYRAPLLA